MLTDQLVKEMGIKMQVSCVVGMSELHVQHHVHVL